MKAPASTVASPCSPYVIPILCITLVLPLLTYLFLFISLCIAFRKRKIWFSVDPRSRNPYVLVYKVISFARQHKVPIQRSAFTYCEEELPSRLDLGKEKYGGPFTTEQVEDVKVFLGILKVLLTLGPLFTVERSVGILFPALSKHLSGVFYPCSFVSNDFFPSLVIVFLLVFYTVLLRPLIHNYIPGMLKRIGLGMTLMVMPILCFLIFDTVLHKLSQTSPGCFLNELHGHSDGKISSSFLFIPIFFYISGSMIFYIAIYEFIYAQSPHSMKGLMIGTFFALRGIFQLVGALIFMFPFIGWNLSSPFPSCGFVYFLVNIVVALLGIVVYIWVARKYQNRQRDEPDNVYRYAEEYYAKAQDEPNYDYDDYDNLNVHTIN